MSGWQRIRNAKNKVVEHYFATNQSSFSMCSQVFVPVPIGQAYIYTSSEPVDQRCKTCERVVKARKAQARTER